MGKSSAQILRVRLVGRSRIIASRIAAQVANSTESWWTVAWGRIFSEGNICRRIIASVDRRTTNVDRLASPVSAYVVQAGTVIPGALITGIRSDLPGQITAQVSENVYDSPTGNYLLISQGARLIGQYDSQIAFGQSRVLLVWTRLLMPNGRSIVLERQPGTDAAGYSGLEDEVDNHWGVLFKAAVLSTLLSVGSEAGTSGNENNLVQAIRRGGSQSFNQVGQRVVSRNLDIQPTLTIRPGFPVRVIVSRDLMLTPYHRESAR